ncbi:hypothetical protein P7C73_g175, partial [Tremellales sp. Uapishka_1]
MMLSLRPSTSKILLPLRSVRNISSTPRVSKASLLPTCAFLIFPEHTRPSFAVWGHAVIKTLTMTSTAETPLPIDLLSKIGRNAEKKLASNVESWDGLNELWKKGGEGLKDAGLGIKDRRYILWAFNKYSLGNLPSTFITPPTPPKKIRGWGPRVQNGVRVR